MEIVIAVVSFSTTDRQQNTKSQLSVTLKNAVNKIIRKYAFSQRKINVWSTVPRGLLMIYISVNHVQDKIDK